MERYELIEKMRGRVKKCRRSAAHTIDEQTRLALCEMADEGEADLALLLADKTDE